MKKYFLHILICDIIAVVFGAFFFTRFLPNTNSVQVVDFKDTLQTTPVLSSSSAIINHSITPVVSNQWYSSIYKKFPTQPIFALPLAYMLSPNGISFSYPDVTASTNTITAPFNEDFTVGLSDQFVKPSITSIGDWNIGISLLTHTNNSLSFILAHGVPSTLLHVKANSVVIHLQDNSKIYNQNKTLVNSKTFSTDSFLLQIHNHNYILVLNKTNTIAVDKNTLTIANPTTLYVGLLDDRSHYNNFLQTADTEILGTSAIPTLSDSALSVKYQLATNTGKQLLIALYPHQYDTLTEKVNVLGKYDTIRGSLNLITADTFSTSIALVMPPDSFSKLSSAHTDLVNQVKTDIAGVLRKPKPDSTDYYLGTWFGEIDNLLLLADTLGLTEQKNALLQFVEPIFVKSLSNFHYDTKQNSLIADSPEFGNEKLNDHHFHYGYYIRTASVLAKFDPASLSKTKTIITKMVNDIATIDRNSENYPYLRNFDAYESHSWADGYADFADGNNQESSSEAINAWYGMYLWSKVTNSPKLEQYALYLYNSEILGAKYYWFNSTGIYDKPYSHAIASLVWGGKVDFATWFSNDTNMKYGIQLLPITPASTYLGSFQDIGKYDSDYHVNEGDETKSWGDLFTIWRSFYDDRKALSFKDAVKSFDDKNTKSMLLYILYLNSK